VTESDFDIGHFGTPQCSSFITLDRTRLSGAKLAKTHSSPSSASAISTCLGMPIWRYMEMASVSSEALGRVDAAMHD